MPTKHIWRIRKKFWSPINEDKIYLGDFNGAQLVRLNNAKQLTIGEMEKLTGKDSYKFEPKPVKKQ